MAVGAGERQVMCVSLTTVAGRGWPVSPKPHVTGGVSAPRPVKLLPSMVKSLAQSTAVPLGVILSKRKTLTRMLGYMM